MAIYAVVDGAGLIVNRIVVESGGFKPDTGTLIAEDSAPYEIGGKIVSGVYTAPPSPTPSAPQLPPNILSQDLMAQFTTDDLTKIKTAIEANIQFWGLWSAMQAQKDPMYLTNARFLKGWTALVSVLGQPRMDAIAVALNVTIG